MNQRFNFLSMAFLSSSSASYLSILPQVPPKYICNSKKQNKKNLKFTQNKFKGEQASPFYDYQVKITAQSFCFESDNLSF